MFNVCNLVAIDHDAIHSDLRIEDIVPRIQHVAPVELGVPNSPSEVSKDNRIANALCTGNLDLLQGKLSVVPHS